MIKRIAAVFLFLMAVDANAQTVDDLFNENVLHEVRLDIRPKDWAYLKEHFREDNYFPCNFHWMFNGRDVQAPQIACRNRGTGSRTPIKPGLRLAIDRYDRDRTFLGLKTIILRNNSQDASMMHERIALAFMRRMGIPAPRSTHARLYVNGVYAGLYTIVEEVDEVFTQKVYGDSTGYLYKYDYDATDPAHIFEYLGPSPGSYIPKPFRPESHEDNPRGEVIEEWWRTINQSSDANISSAVNSYMNVSAFVHEIAVENYLAEQDGILGDYGLNNFYIYRLANSNRFNFIPWDKSNSFWAINRSIYSGTVVNILARRLLQNGSMPLYVASVQQAIQSAGGTGGWLETEIIRVYNMIRTAALEDPNKVCDPGASGNLRPCSNAEFEAEAANMMRFARERPGVVARELGITP